MNKELTYISKFDTRKHLVLFFVLSLFFSNPFETISQNDKFIVVIDAGHGGKDPGGVANGYREKDVALNVSLLLGKMLSNNNEIKVIYTRKKDEFIGLWKRGKIANNAKADLFASIHCNHSWSLMSVVTSSHVQPEPVQAEPACLSQTQYFIKVYLRLA